ncbi:MAG TPA: C25 family cysteine peptidase, partial [Ohtaekwangia sp.]|nr:C25 family cysteine peptidase [Ohtaekwangia sp.]
IDFNYNRSPDDFDLYRDLIPSAGTPASDAYYTAGIAGSQHTAAVPTGRITASAPEHVAAYLNKVKERELMPFDNLSRKNLLHLSGGIEEGEPARFKSYVRDFESVAEGYFLGGKVASIAKQSADVELINIADEVNRGLNLVTFFGHSSASTLDFDIGYVTDPVMGYNNKGKYPMMLMHGCNAGSFFQEDMLFGEDWIFAQDKGAVGFIAHTFFGLEFNLKKYGDAFYAVAFGDSTFLSKGIGDIHKETARRYMQTAAATAANITQVQQMILLGDPAVPLFGASKPDLEINANTIAFESFDGESITALSDSFAIKIVVRNFGQARPDTLRLQVERILSDNSVITYDTLIPPVLYSDTVRFTIRNGREDGSGNNIFNITIDADDYVDELNELNNTASREFAVPLNGTRNLFPRDFSIVNDRDINLSWQTTDVLSGERDFEVEVDTTHTFDSPYRKSFQVTGRVLGRQSFSLPEDDSVVYYWRTRLADPLPGESLLWTETSFTYIENGQEGWAQMDFPQYLKNTTEGLVTDAVREELRFKETVTDVIIKTFGASHPSSNEDVSVKIGGAEYNLFTQSGGGFGCRDNTINLIAFERRSTAPYVGIPFKYYNRAGRSCGREPWVINSFRPGELVTGNNDDIVAYVNNVASGDSVVIFSIGDAGYAAWPVAAKSKLAELGIGAVQLDALQAGEPVVIFGRKGAAPGTAKIYTAPAAPAGARLDVAGTITGRYNAGAMSSLRIGPAAAWESFQLHVSDVEPQDDIRFDLVGVALNGTETVLFPGVTAAADLSGISAAAYPYLKVVAKTEDAIMLTSPQLDRWLVLYTPVPEGFIAFMGPAEQQTLIEGQPWRGDYGFINIGDKPFSDSLMVRYETFNQQQSGLISNSLKIKAPAPGDTTTFSITVDTKERNGLNDVEVFVNPRVLPEQYYDNNIVALKDHLLVQMDNHRPVLEVVVDGRKLVSGDFVSANPTIVVRVWDENKGLLKRDTEGMRLFLTYPCGMEVCSPSLIALTDETVAWFAATDTSDFRIVFTPATLTPGKYTLRAEAADARGNGSGAEPYQVDFTVTDVSSFSISAPYPNPFYNEVYFNAVIAGSEQPGPVEMQIVDVTGKVVRQFPPRPLHVGTNEWSWDGTDHAGNYVPTGVYICHVYLTVEGKQIQENRRVVFLR